MDLIVGRLILFVGIPLLLIGIPIALLILERFTSGTLKRVIRILIHLFSVLGFLGFLFFISGLLEGVCSPGLNQAVVISTAVCTLFFVGIFYYIGRRRM